MSLAIPATVLGIIVIIYFIHIYNSLVQLKHYVARAWANINVLLKQRHDELPKLVETCRQYMTYERETLERVMQARSAVMAAGEHEDAPGLSMAESQLRRGLSGLLALAEEYPDLRASEAFQKLLQRISGLEEALSDRRELYNESVTNHNIRIGRFPANLVAGSLGYQELPQLDFAAEEKADHDLRGLFNR